MSNCQKIIDGYDQIEPFEEFKDIVYEMQGLDFAPLKNSTITFDRGNID